MSDVEDLKWWERYRLDIEAEIRLTPGDISVRDWLFYINGNYYNQYHGYNCVWINGCIRILGFWIGAGLFLRGKKIDHGQ